LAQERIVLEYGFEGRRYVLDFFVELNDGRKLLQEVKGWIRDEEEHRLKCEVAQQYCKENGLEFSVLFYERLKSI